MGGKGNAAPPKDTITMQREPMIQTQHFHNKPMPLTSVLFALAGQEGCDGDEYNAMQMAGEYIKHLSSTGSITMQREDAVRMREAIDGLRICHGMAQAPMCDHAYWNDEFERKWAEVLAIIDKVLTTKEGESL